MVTEKEKTKKSHTKNNTNKLLNYEGLKQLELLVF